MREGVDGLLRDKTRPPGRKPLEPAIIEQVVALTAKDPPAETTHWTAGLMAKMVGISVSSVRGFGRRMGYNEPGTPVQLHAASSASGVHPLPERHRGGYPGRQTCPCGAR